MGVAQSVYKYVAGDEMSRQAGKESSARASGEISNALFVYGFCDVHLRTRQYVFPWHVHRLTIGLGQPLISPAIRDECCINIPKSLSKEMVLV